MLRHKEKSQLLPESIIQKKVTQKFEAAGWLVVKIIQTTMNGWPDLQCHKDGVTIFVECKASGKSPGALQRYRHAQLRDQGFRVLVVYNADNLFI